MDDALRMLPPAWRQALQQRCPISSAADTVAALHALSAVLALTLGLLSFDGSLFGWHPLGMALGYQFFMAEGILSALSLRPVTNGPDRVRGITAHAQAQLRAVGCVAVGAGSILLNKSLHGKRHFTTTHGKVGLLTLVVTAAAPLLGALAFRSWRLMQRLFGSMDPSHLLAAKRAHRALGSASYFLSVLTIQLALGHRSVRRAYMTPLWRLMALAAAGGMAGALVLGTGGAEGGGRVSGGGAKGEEAAGGSGGASSGGGGSGSAGGATGAAEEAPGDQEELTGAKAV